MRQLTEQETYEKARKATKYNLFELVGEEAYGWSKEKRENEAFESASIILSERRNHPEIDALVHDRMMTLYINDLPRVPIEDLAFDSQHEAILSGYWPYKCQRCEVRELLESHNFRPHADYVSQAHSDVRRGIVDQLTDF
jgi:hypothetical protein